MIMVDLWSVARFSQGLSPGGILTAITPELWSIRPPAQVSVTSTTGSQARAMDVYKRIVENSLYCNFVLK